MKKTSYYVKGYGEVDLSIIGNGRYEVYDSFDDTYYGTVYFGDGEAITPKAIEEKLEALRA